VTWDPFAPAPHPTLAVDPAWVALAAALRQAAPAVEAIALAELTAPSWRPGETAEHAAYAEGGKAVWRTLLALAERRIAALEARIAAERDVYLRQPMYELLAQHQRAAVVLAADEAAAARLVSAPSVEENPSVPNRPLLFGLLLLAAPLAVCGIAAAAILARQPPPPAPPGETLVIGRLWPGTAGDLAAAIRAADRRDPPP
jgi:hypothetical protein